MRNILFLLLTISFTVQADSKSDRKSVERAVKDYIESQHLVNSEMMERGVDLKLVKRTYWKSSSGEELILESDYDGMSKLAGSYNKKGDKFPSEPKIEIKIFDIEERVASVKLTADDWIDYMHLYKNEQGKWKIINVLWQFNDIEKHASKKKS